MESIDYKEIANQIKRTLAGRGIPLNKAAQLLGVTPQGINSQLSGRPFSRKTAMMYNQVFGFNIDYMLTGKGYLSDDSQPSMQTEQGVIIPRETIKMYTSMAQSIENLTTLVNQLIGQTPLKKEGLHLDNNCPQDSI